MPASQQPAIRILTKTAIKLPAQLGVVLQNSEVSIAAHRFIASQRESGTMLGSLLGKLGDQILAHPDAFADEVAKAAARDAHAGGDGSRMPGANGRLAGHTPPPADGGSPMR